MSLVRSSRPRGRPASASVSQSSLRPVPVCTPCSPSVAVQPPEPLVAGADDRAAVVGLGEVAGDEHALALQRVAHGFAPLAVAAADDDAGRPQPCDAPRDGGAKALCAAGHYDDLAVEALIGEKVVHAWSTYSKRTGRT